MSVREQILRRLKEKEMSFWEILSGQDYTLKEVVEELTRLLKEKIIGRDSQKKKFFLYEKEISKSPRTKCGFCQGRGVVAEGIFKEALQRFTQIIQKRPIPIVDFDQGVIAPLDLALKAAFMYERGDVEGKDIIVLGDDDLFGVYLGLTGICKNIQIIEIDERLVKFIGRVGEEENLPLKVIQQDLTKPLPFSLLQRFDAFVSEPPETIKGLRVFIKRGIETLKDGGAGYFGLTTLESSLEKWLVLEKFLLAQGMVITDIRRSFSLYPEKDVPWGKEFYSRYQLFKKLPFDPGELNVDWYTSSLIRIKKIGKKVKLLSGDLYMDEETWATPASFQKIAKISPIKGRKR